MGRITVFSTATCPHCKRAKALLASKGWEYSEVSLSDYPERRSAMLQLADRLSVPQIFFNEKHVGGASDLAALEERGQLLAWHEEMAAGAEPADPRLAVPEHPPPPQPEPPAREPEPAIELGADGATATYPELAAQLAAELDIGDRSYRTRRYPRCFVGREAVDVLQRLYGVTSREAAVALGARLQEAGLFDHVEGDHSFRDEFLFYRLQADATPAMLNTCRRWRGAAQAAVPCVKRLKKALSSILSAHTGADGRVDYLAAAGTAEYRAFHEDSCELQAVDYLSLRTEERLAFGVNLYNLMLLHAFAQLGPPADAALERNSFFNDVGYEVAGQCLSFRDLEHGVLRGNVVPPGPTFSRPFGSGDPRLAFVIPLDNRIHFGLNCGAASCPPIKDFTAEAIDEELRIVAMAFCEQEENVRVDTESRTLWLSQIFNWYAKDFGPDPKAVGRAVCGWLRGEKAAALESLLGGKLHVKHLPYDWSTNAKGARVFAESMGAGSSGCCIC